MKDISEFTEKIIQGDCLDVMREMPDNSVDAIVCDPPAGISFMGKEWDGNKGGRDEWIKWMAAIATECKRVLKPGGHALVWALPRTSHWTATAWENAGFQVRDRISHIFGSGFPKSMDISKQIDRAAGMEREKVIATGGLHKNKNMNDDNWKNIGAEQPMMDCSIPASPEAKQWEGWGTALKPAMEDWWLFRNPVEGTVAENVLKWGTGGINIDACRIKHKNKDDLEESTTKNQHKDFNSNDGVKCPTKGIYHGDFRPPENYDGSSGRFPSNVILQHHPECVQLGLKKVKAITGGRSGHEGAYCGGYKQEFYGDMKPGKGDEDGMETVENWKCHPDCPIRIMDEQSGNSKSCGGSGEKSVASKLNTSSVGCTSLVGLGGYGDIGGASRFFYCAKPAKSERDVGCDSIPEQEWVQFQTSNGTSGNPSSISEGRNTAYRNIHPTVKALELMQYLIKLVTKEEQIVLDPFAGSGSTCLACAKINRRYIGIELNEEYCKIARKRISSMPKRLDCFDSK